METIRQDEFEAIVNKDPIIRFRYIEGADKPWDINVSVGEHSWQSPGTTREDAMLAVITFMAQGAADEQARIRAVLRGTMS